MNDNEKQNNNGGTLSEHEIVMSGVGKLIDVIDRNTGNTINGDVWRLALDCVDRLGRQTQSMRMDLKQMEVDLEQLTNTIKKIERRWEGIET